MAKKLSLLLAATAVLVLAVPTFAKAATGLTEHGSLIKPEGTIVATNIGAFTITSAKTGNLTCQQVSLTTTLTANTSATVAAKGAGSSNASNCTVGIGGAVTITKPALTSLDTTGGGTGSFTLSLSADLSGVTCTYSTSSGTFSYNPTATSEGDDTITFSSVTLTVTPPACGTTAQLDGKFTLETDESTTPVYLM